MDLYPASANSFLGYCLADRYRFTDILGEGGMGFVFLAEDLELPRTVAVKMIRPELSQDKVVQKRVERECAMHASVGIHPNIVTLHDKIIKDGKIFLVIEYVKGETLSKILKTQSDNGQQIDFFQSILIVTQLLTALDIIHNNNIIHRDIKPSNIIVIPGRNKGDSVTAKLMDFGIARAESDDPDVTRLTALDSAGPGTPAYMAPERIDSKSFGDYSPATDLYSLGVIFYELLHAKPPFYGSLTDIFTAHITKEPDVEVLDTTTALKKVIAKSLNKSQEDRYSTAIEFRTAIHSTISNAESTKTGKPPEDGDEHSVTLLSTPEMHLNNDFSRDSNEIFPEQRKKTTQRAMLFSSLVVVILFLSGGTYFLSINNDRTSQKGDTEEPPIELPEKSPDSISDIIVPPSIPPDEGLDPMDDILPPPPTTPEAILVTPPSPPELYPGYYPSLEPFKGIGNPSPDVDNKNNESSGKAEGSVNAAFDSPIQPTVQKTNNNRRRRTNVNNSPAFKIREQGTRPVSSQ